METQSRCLVHATAVSVAGRAALIFGPSGAGKSDLALRLITGSFVDAGKPVSVELVSDDQVVLERTGNSLVASPPASIAGKLEVRGLGIMPFAHVAAAEVGLAVEIKSADTIERLPDPRREHTILGVRLPLIEIDAREPGAPARLVIAALRLGGA